MPRERPAVAEETLITPLLTPRVMTVVVWSSSSVIPATSPTASSSWESWLLMLSTVTCVLPRSGTTCSETSLMARSVVEKTPASRSSIQASTKNATAIPAKSIPFINSTKASKPYRTSRQRNRIITSIAFPAHTLGRAPGHNAPADYLLAISGVEHRRLAGRDAHHRPRETRDPLGSVLLDLAGSRRAVVAHLHEAGFLGGEEPVQVADPDLPHLEVPLRANHDLPGGRAYLGHVQRRRRRNPYAASLAHRKVHDARVAPERLAFGVHDDARLSGNLLADKVPVVAVRDKADVLALRRV